MEAIIVEKMEEKVWETTDLVSIWRKYIPYNTICTAWRISSYFWHVYFKSITYRKEEKCESFVRLINLGVVCRWLIVGFFYLDCPLVVLVSCKSVEH